MNATKSLRKLSTVFSNQTVLKVTVSHGKIEFYEPNAFCNVLSECRSENGEEKPQIMVSRVRYNTEMKPRREASVPLDGGVAKLFHNKRLYWLHILLQCFIYAPSFLARKPVIIQYFLLFNAS